MISKTNLCRAEDAAKLEALRDAARVGFAAFDRGEYKEFESVDDLRDYLNELSKKVILSGIGSTATPAR